MKQQQRQKRKRTNQKNNQKNKVPERILFPPNLTLFPGLNCPHFELPRKNVNESEAVYEKY